MNDSHSTSDTGRFHLPNLAGEHRRRPAITPIVRDTYALILAGGRGSRLQQLTDWRSKPAVPFGGKHRIVDFALSNCINSGVRRIGVATQYKAHSLIQHLQHGWNFLDPALQEFVDVLPAQQRLREGWYSGTADALYQNLDILRMQSPRFVLVLAGDHVYKMDYGVMLAEHVERGADVSIPCLEVPLESASAFGVMRVDDDGRVREFVEKPAQPVHAPGAPSRALVSMGIYVFNAEALYGYLRADARCAESTHDFGRDVIPKLLRDGERVYAHRFADSCVNMTDGHPYWRDVGTVDAYWEANLDLTRVQPGTQYVRRAVADPHARRALAAGQVRLRKRRSARPDARCAGVERLHRERCLGHSLPAVHRRHRGKGSVIEDSVLLPKVRVGRNVRLRRAIVDKYCVLPDGFVAGLDRAADEARFHVTPRGTVLITPEMLGQEFHDAG